MLKNRISVGYLNKVYHTNDFFLTEFFDGHYKCPAINNRDVGKRLRNILFRNYSVWERDDALYVLGKKQKDEK